MAISLSMNIKHIQNEKNGFWTSACKELIWNVIKLGENTVYVFKELFYVKLNLKYSIFKMQYCIMYNIFKIQYII